jgi:uncharacterized protein (TIGR02466 family)
MYKNLFSIVILDKMMPDFDEIKDEMVSHIMKLYDGKRTENHPLTLNSGGLVLMPHLEEQFDLKSVPGGDRLCAFIEEEARAYWKEMNYDDEREPFIRYTWSCLGFPGSQWKLHYHLPSVFGGCFYLDAEPDRGNIIFEDPMDYILGSQPYKEPGDFMYFEKEVDAITGKLLMFPAYLKHRVGVNTSDKTRLIVGYDIGVRDKPKSK